VKGRQLIKKDKAKNPRNHKVNPLLPVLFGFTVILLTFLAYLRSLNAPLIFDDSTYIEPSRLKVIFSHFSLRARSIAELSFALNYQISGMNLSAFRVTNIIFHIASGALAAYLTYVTLDLPYLRDKYGKVWDRVTPVHISAAVAVLFLLHPIQTAAVNYITQRMAIMAAMFSFAGLIFYIKGAVNRGRKSMLYYSLSAFSFVLAIFSKENAVMVLLMLPVYDLIFISSFRWKEFRKRFISILVLLIASALIVAYNMPVVGFLEKILILLLNPHQPIGIHGWTGVDIQWTPMEYILTELRVVSRYILLILFPSPSLMVFDYSNAYPASKNLFNPVSTFLSLVFLVSLLFFSLRYIKRFPLISFGIFWYLINISLESFIAVGLDPYFEHRNYLPSLGPFLALASLLVYIDKSGIRTRKSGHSETLRNSFSGGRIIMPVIALLLFILTFVRNGVWSNEGLLWKDALDKSPNNLRALITLSSIYINDGRFQEAEEYLQRAGKIQPITPRFKVAMLINQATLYKATNRRKDALAVLRGLISDGSLSDEQQGDINFIMGEILREEGRHSEARKYLERAYEIKHDNPFLIISLGLVSRSLDEIEKAEGYFKMAIEIAPGQPIPYVELGDIYFMKGDIEKAENYYRTAIAMPDIAGGIAKRVFLNLAQIKLKRGAIDESAVLFKKVIEIDPLFYPPYIFLGDIYLKSGNPDTALAYLERALSLKATFVKDDPNTRLVYFNLGMAYARKGDKRQARRNLRLFLSMAGGDKRLEAQIERAKRELAQM